MPVYTVFDCDGVSVEVSDSALERAAAGSGPLATELVNAAALARRPSLVPQIQAGLTGPDRAPKLAAAKALLSLGARATIPLLERLAATESDAVVANVYTAVATRLRGPEAATAQFLSPKTDPQVARFLISNYNSYLQLESGDLKLLVLALGRYLAPDLPALKKLSAELWDNGIDLILGGLSRKESLALLLDPALTAERQALPSLLAQIQLLALPKETKKRAQRLAAALPSP